MPDDTTILSLPLILPAQAQKHVTHNEALVKLDLMVQLAVINRTLTAPPPLPVIGDRHIVAAGATGSWIGQAGRIAMYTQAGWQFTQPLPGWQAYVMAESQMAFFNGLTWIALSDGPFAVGRLGVSATPDATNRLAVSSPATLLNHAGSGHQLKLNKAVGSDTASLLFQTGFGGRAEMGTAGSDDFSVKVSADGSAWSVAMVAGAATGEVTLPQPVHLGGQAVDPAAPVDGTLWLNTTTGEVKVRSAGATQVVGGGGGGVSDGDKGDISVAGSGTVWTIDAGAVSLGKLADVATDSFLGRDSAGTGSPEALTVAQARGILNVADGATANAADAALRDRATHTGTQGAATITGLAAVATSGSAADLTAGTLPAARFDDTAHGSRAGGGLHAVATGAAAGFMAAADKAKLDAISGTNTGDRTITLTGDVTGSGTGSFGATIAAGAVTNVKLADVASGTIKGRVTAGTGAPEDLTGMQATALLDVFDAVAKGLAPPSGGGTVNFLRADGSWAAPAGGGGGSPGGASGALQYNSAGAFAGAADVEIEGGQLRLNAVASPGVPAAGGVKLYGTDYLGPTRLGFLGPDGKVRLLQNDLGEFSVQRFQPAAGLNSLVGENSLNLTVMGTATAAATAITRLHVMKPRLDVLVTTASATAIAGIRPNAAAAGRPVRVGRDANAPGGFLVRFVWAPATGVSNASHRAFCGLDGTTNTPTDVEPSGSTSNTGIVGMGWDAADANIQIMHNDTSGTATKIDLGSSFPVPSTDRGEVYEVQLYSPNSLTQSVSYRVIRYDTSDNTVLAEATGTITTNLPPVGTLLGPHIRMSVGGVSSVVGIACMGILIGREY
ncbi:DUF2793 domain-containing protein [Tabrizicola sp.]|uniref:DUF2793 domain-containing protein n=1 Tax=Tabrizicola sp. TaxID=2005166 RepID=UPI001A6004B0|nr:DUF2793 domain-containing protein [Tabrizicola sp.]MBL9075798.1 DUF2793 domain-containing protein [Tabrizicola sp.]